MKLLLTLSDPQFPKNSPNFMVREAVRIVAFDENGLIPILYVSKFAYHKLPGGGIDEDEDKQMALIREMREETGCEIEVKGEVGEIIEYKSGKHFGWKYNFKQISYCYWGTITSKGKGPRFTQEELDKGYQLQWYSLEEARNTLESDRPQVDAGIMIKKRDLTFLKQYLALSVS